MTFTEIKTEILDRLGLTSTDDDTRVGRAINRVYKKVTSDLGIKHVSKRTTASATCTIGVSTLTFTASEKPINVFNRNVTPYEQLIEYTMDELEAEMPFGTSDAPTKYAVKSLTSDTVVILLNCIPQTAFDLYADVYGTKATLSGSDEPAFSESAHDILVHGVLVDEYMKIEKPTLSKVEEGRYKERMGELRLFNTVSTTRDLHQGKTSLTGQVGASSGGSGAVNGALSYTQTGLITFDRSAGGDIAPFAVAAAADAVVTNLDADKLDGQHGAYYAVAAALNASALTTGTVPDARFPATLPAASGVNLTALNASNLASGTVPDARFPATLPAASGVNLTNVNALTLEGYTSAQLAVLAEAETVSGAWAFSNAAGVVASHASGGFTERARSTAMGEWIAVTFAAGNFTGSGSMTWTVESADQVVFKYMLIGKTLWVSFSITTTTVGGTPSTDLQIIIPGGFTAAARAANPVWISDNGTTLTGYAVVTASGQTNIRVRKNDSGNWAAATNTSGVEGQIAIEIS